MSNEDPDQAQEQSPRAVSEQSLAETERMFLRLTLWQTVLSVVGVVIAIIALYAALTESAAVRQQTAAAVWPFVQFAIEDSDTAGTADFTISLTNTGVGPARIRAVQLIIEGEPVTDWASAVERQGGEIIDRVSRNFVNNRVLSPDEQVVAFSTWDPVLARNMLATVASPDTYIVYCYCSIFDDCWLADSRRDLHEPEAVAACPDFGDAAFRN